MPTDEQIYADCMSRLRDRLNVIDDVLSGRISVNHQGLMAEVIFLQFRKSLEELAFASLSANRDIYAAVHAKFSVHWKAKDMLTELGRVNANFYPVALQPPKEKHFERLLDGFMTRDEFIDLYKHSSEALHTRNPYKEGDPTIRIGFTVQEWSARFRNLIRWHSMTLVSGRILLCNVPDGGPIHVYTSAPTPE